MIPRHGLGLALAILFAVPQISQAQNTAEAEKGQAAQPAAINYRERPKLPFNPQRLKRKPVIDGSLGDKEWDELYTVTEGAVTGTVYFNWDDDFIYVAAKTTQTAWTVIDLDANNDGWLRGTDNLEIAVAPLTEGVAQAVVARVLDAATNKDTPVWSEKSVDIKAIQVVSKASGSGQIVELAIPKGLAGLAPKANGGIGFRADFLPAAATPSPTPPYEPHLLLDLKLVEEQVVEVQGIRPKLDLEDNKLVPGQRLFATLDIASTDDQVQLKAVSWRGEGGAADILRTLRDPNTGRLSTKKPLRVKYSSQIPENAAPGFYQITSVIELEGGKTATATTGFEVVEPFVVQLAAAPDPFAPSSTEKMKVGVDITNNVNAYVRGDVELEVPAGWVVEGRKKKQFDAPREDGTIKTQFFVSVPTTVAEGEYNIHATVSWKGKSVQAHRLIHIGKAEAAPVKAKAAGK